MYFIPHTITYDLSFPWAARQEATLWIESKQWSLLGVRIKILNYNFLNLKGMSRREQPLPHPKKRIRKQMNSEKPVPPPSPKSKIETLIKPREGAEEVEEGASKLANLPPSSYSSSCVYWVRRTNTGNGAPSQGSLRPRVKYNVP